MTSAVIKNVQATIDAMWKDIPSCRARQWNPFALPCTSTQWTRYEMARNQQVVFDRWKEQAAYVHDGSVPFDRWAQQGQNIINAARSLMGLQAMTDPWKVIEETAQTGLVGTDSVPAAVTKIAYIGVAGMALYAVAKVVPELLRLKR